MPTWNATNAPQIIEKQFGLMRIIEEETKANDVVDQGILDRLTKAKRFYESILLATEKQ